MLIFPARCLSAKRERERPFLNAALCNRSLISDKSKYEIKKKKISINNTYSTQVIAHKPQAPNRILNLRSTTPMVCILASQQLQQTQQRPYR